MTTFGSVLSTVIASGTWTNYGSTPTIIDDKKTARGRHVKNGGVQLKPKAGKPVVALDGSIINHELLGEVEFFHQTSVNRDKLVADFYNVLDACAYAWDVVNFWTVDERDNYQGHFEVSIIS